MKKKKSTGIFFKWIYKKIQDSILDLEHFHLICKNRRYFVQKRGPFLPFTEHALTTADFIYKVLGVYTRSMETIYLSLGHTGS